LFWDLVLLHENYHDPERIESRDLLRFAHAMGVTGEEAGAQMEAALVIFGIRWFPADYTPREIFGMSIEEAVEVSWDGIMEREYAEKQEKQARKLARRQARK
jgi:hypothetical protein